MIASSTLKSLENIDISVLGSEDLEEMTPEDRIWAQQQFRLIYSQEMSKLTSQIMHQNRIKNNLQRVNLQQKQEIHKNYIRLKHKMQLTDNSRQKKVEQKKNAYKNQEQKWVKKMEQIQRRFKSQNRQAVQKAEKYRRQSEDYWYKKQQFVSSSKQLNMYQKRDLNKTEKYIRADNMNNNTIRFKNNEGKKTKSYLNTLKVKQNDNHQNSKYPISQYRTIDINAQILRHKKRSQSLQQDKEAQIFKSAVQKLMKIQESRKKAQKYKLSSLTPTQVKKIRVNNEEEEQNRKFYSNNNNQRSSISTIKQKESLDESIQSHLQAKKIIQQQEFSQRNKRVQVQHRRKVQDKILKLIKNKVKDIRKSAMKLAMQNQA